MSAATLVLTYALFRWGSGREAAGGLGVILLWLPITTVADPTSLAETVAGYAFFLFAAALGAAIRYRAKIRIRDIDQAKAREREQLARELHDTVAHHVSGIAIQAQAGRAIAASHPERAVEALAIIEDAATRTLTELRAIVGVLRASQDTEFAPQPGVAEVEQLATDGQTRPCVEVNVLRIDRTHCSSNLSVPQRAKVYPNFGLTANYYIVPPQHHGPVAPILPDTRQVLDAARLIILFLRKPV